VYGISSATTAANCGEELFLEKGLYSELAGQKLRLLRVRVELRRCIRRSRTYWWVRHFSSFAMRTITR
jgi:hypothetical protein